MTTKTIIERARAKGLRMTPQRLAIAKIIGEAKDHPNAEEVYKRASEMDADLSLATVYRTLKQFESAGILERLNFGDGWARFEDARRAHHDHLFDIDTGVVIEFVDPEIEALQEKIAAKYGYELVGHKFELFGRKLQKKNPC